MNLEYLNIKECINITSLIFNHKCFNSLHSIHLFCFEFDFWNLI